jgi:hypothetical protein
MATPHRGVGRHRRRTGAAQDLIMMSRPYRTRLDPGIICERRRSFSGKGASVR